MIGLGKMGILHSGIVSSLPDARVTAICERESFLIRTAKALLPKTVSFYRDHLKMVTEEELDAVFITTPIDTHVPLILDIVRTNNRLNLFVEKPLAISGQQARMACEAVGQMRGIHMVGFQKRFSPVFQKARDYLANGILGELMFFRACSFSSDVFREGKSWRFQPGRGGVLLDLAPHLLDLLSWFFGDVVEAMADAGRIYSSQVDDYVHAVMIFESGLNGHIDVCWSMRGFRLPEISIEVYGRNGMLTVTDDLVKVTLKKENNTAIREGNVFYRQSFDNSVSFLLADPEFTREDEAFLSGIQKRTLPGTNFLQAEKVNVIIDRINESVNRQKA
jgi:predicted dehydrogenase